MSKLSRRSLVLGCGALAAGCAIPRPVAIPVTLPETAAGDAASALAALEAQANGRLGAYVLDTATGEAFGHRADERFAMCSTFKMALAALILMEVDAGRVDFDQRVAFGQSDMVANSPIARQNLERGFMTVAQMAQGTQQTSDNTCANLLLRQLDGPDGFTQRIRALGDLHTRVDRYEPEMNLVPPGEVRDTTTPQAHARLMQTLLTGDALSSDSRRTLIQWMIDTRTGLRRIRAGLPTDWNVGDKTGTGYNSASGNSTNDIAILFPPNRAPVVVTAYLNTTYFEGIRDEDQAALAEVGRIAAQWIMAG
jgi:beta-lactamase class A